jgi:hypothetical protein
VMGNIAIGTPIVKDKSGLLAGVRTLIPESDIKSKEESVQKSKPLFMTGQIQS